MLSDNSKYRYYIEVLIVLSLLFSAISAVSINDLAYFSARYESDTIPQILQTGVTGQYSVTFSNDGMMAWKNERERFGVLITAPDLKIDPEIPTLPNGPRIANGKSYQFIFSLTPENDGEHILSISMVRVKNDEITHISDVINKTVISSKDTIKPIQKTGAIEVSSGDFYVTVFLDDELKGTTPLTLSDVPVGEHSLLLVGGAYNRTRIIEVRPETVTIVREDFTGKEDSYLENPADEDPLKSLILTNFFILLGLFLGFAAFGIYSVITITRIVKKIRFSVGMRGNIPTQIIEVQKYHAIITKRGSSNRELVAFFPIGAFGREGEECIAQVLVKNSGKRPVIVEKQKVSGRSEKIITLNVKGGNIGDEECIWPIHYTDYSGQTFIRTIRIVINTSPKDLPINWFFDRFKKQGKSIIAVIKCHNKSKDSITFDKTTIHSQKEEEVDLSPEPSEEKEHSIMKMVSISSGGKKWLLPVRIPYNKGVSFWSEKKIEEAVLYLKEAVTTDPDVKNDPDLLYVSSLIHSMETSEKSKDKGKDKDKVKTSEDSEENPVEGFPEEFTEQYEPVKIIGHDRSGTIYEVVRESDKNSFAMKIPDTSIIPIGSLEGQIHAWRSLKCPQILRLHAWNVNPGPSIILDLPSGMTQYGLSVYSLADLKVPIPVLSAVLLTLDIAKGVSYMHHQGFRHYLLEPANIWLSKGLKAQVGGIDTAFLSISRNIPKDCPVLAPEQLNPGRWGSVGKKTDIYQIGCILYYLMTGRYPYPPPDRWDSLLVLPSAIRPGFSDFDSFLNLCLNYDKMFRFSDVDDVISELSAIEKKLREEKGKNK